MLPSSATAAADSRPTAFDSKHPASGDCGNCHVTTPDLRDQSVTDRHQARQSHPDHRGLRAVPHHGGQLRALFRHRRASGRHDLPELSRPDRRTVPQRHDGQHAGQSHADRRLDCSGSGCHTTKNVNPGGFKIGTASISAPTLNVAGHTTVATAVSGCQTCHESAPYVGMLASTATAAGDSRPTALDKAHPTSGDCNGCHTSTPTFAANVTQSAKAREPHTHHRSVHAVPYHGRELRGLFGHRHAPGRDDLPQLSRRYAGVCQHHDRRQASQSHPDRCLDCNGSGCHTTTNVNPGGFKLGAASINTPTLSIAGHDTIASVVPACQTCHETAPYVGMLASTATAAGDSRPTAFDKAHPTSGDCNGCHTTHPDFAANVTQSGKPANHIPDHRSVHAVPYHGRELRDLFGHRHAPGRDDLPQLSRRDAGVCQHHDRRQASQSHADRRPRLQRFGLSYDDECERRRLQARQCEHLDPDTECRRPRDGRCRGARLRHLP